MSKKLRASARHITEANARGSNEKLVGRDGHINAGSKAEIMQRILEMAEMVQNGEMFTDVSHLNTPDTGGESPSVIIERAFAGDVKAEWAEIGSGLAAELNERLMRDGFLRTLFTQAEVAENSVVRLRVRTPNVTAIVSKGPGLTYPQYVRDKFIFADEFTIDANPRVEELDMHQGSSDILEDKFYEAQEAILVKEDQVTHSLLKETAGIYNSPTYFTGNFTPVILQSMRQSIEDWSLPASNLLFAQDIMTDMIVGGDFTTWYDPVSQYEIIQTGRIGSLLGMNLITDSYREPTLKVLEAGEVFCMSTPSFTGAYTERGPVRSEPQTSYADGVAARGWYLFEHMSITLTNAKAVSTAVKQ